MNPKTEIAQQVDAREFTIKQMNWLLSRIKIVAEDIVSGLKRDRESKSVSNSTNTVTVSGSHVVCTHCGTEQFAYGAPSSAGVSAPFCRWCGLSDRFKSTH